MYNSGYGPSLQDLGYGPRDLEESHLDAAEQTWRNHSRTGWALPQGLEDDMRASFHIFSQGGRSACGKWEAPFNASFEATPINGQMCVRCASAARAHPEHYVWAEDPHQ